MLIALVGPACAGKLEVAKYLVIHHNFRPAFVVAEEAAASHSQVAELTTGSNDGVQSNGHVSDSAESPDGARAALRQAHRYAELVSLVCPNERREALERRAREGAAAMLTLSMPDATPLAFRSKHALLDHATFHWRDNIVTLDLTTRGDLEMGFDKRPFFLLMGVDAPVYTRWTRERARCATLSHGSPSLEEFVLNDDEALFGAADVSRASSLPMTPSTSHSTSLLSGGAGQPASSMAAMSLADKPITPLATTHQVVLPSGMLASRPAPSSRLPSPPSKASGSQASLRDLLASSTLVIHNSHTTITTLHSHLASLRLASTHRLRPTWDTYFLSLCTLASLRSNCMKRRVGAVLVRNNRVLSTGYNGTPRGLVNCAEGGCARCNGGAAGGTALDECLCLHAEENALLECGRERGGAEGTVLYCNTCPCLRCAVKIVQTGVREVVYQLAYSMDDRSRKIFTDANVLFRQYQPA